jgi:hypothetical protein
LAGSFLAVASNYNKIIAAENYNGELLPKITKFDNDTSEISVSRVKHD